MAVNADLVRSIKRTLADKSSDELRKMLESRDVGYYSDEAFAAADELLSERAKGIGQEPPPKPAPRPEPTAAERAVQQDAQLRRQVRLVGAYFYLQASWWAIVGTGLVMLGVEEYRLLTHWVVVQIPCALLILVGWSLRRFSPTARMFAMVLISPQLAAFPIGTLVGFYCLDKLWRSDHLFGVKGHPGEHSG